MDDLYDIKFMDDLYNIKFQSNNKFYKIIFVIILFMIDSPETT
jgi:hypothetical protein